MNITEMDFMVKLNFLLNVASFGHHIHNLVIEKQVETHGFYVIQLTFGHKLMKNYKQEYHEFVIFNYEYVQY